MRRSFLEVVCDSLGTAADLDNSSVVFRQTPSRVVFSDWSGGARSIRKSVCCWRTAAFIASANELSVYTADTPRNIRRKMGCVYLVHRAPPSATYNSPGREREGLQDPPQLQQEEPRYASTGGQGLFGGCVDWVIRRRRHRQFYGPSRNVAHSPLLSVIRPPRPVSVRESLARFARTLLPRDGQKWRHVVAYPFQPARAKLMHV